MIKKLFNKNRKTFLKIHPTDFGWGMGYGFFSNYRACLQQLISNHKEKKLTPYVDWKNTTWVEGFDPGVSKKFPKNQENPFDYWFDQTIPAKSDKIVKGDGKLDFDIIDHAKTYFKSEEINIQREIDSLYLKPKKHIQDKIDEIYSNEFKGKSVLGVMARGSEYNKHHPFYGSFGIKEYIEEIKKIMQKHPEIDKIFAVSEDLEYVSQIKKEFNDVYYMPDVFRRTDETQEYVDEIHYWCNVSTKRENHTKLLGEEVIIQAKLLGKCDHLFGRHSGVLAGAVLWGEKIKHLHIIDENATDIDKIDRNK